MSKADFEGSSSDMEGEASFRMAERLFKAGMQIECIIADQDGMWNWGLYMLTLILRQDIQSFSIVLFSNSKYPLLWAHGQKFLGFAV